MQTTIVRKELLSALQTVSRCVPRRTPKAILRNVRIEANERLIISATDQEKSAVATIDCQTAVDGATLASAEALTKSLKSLKSEFVELKSDPQTGALTLIADQSALPIPAAGENPVSDFPPVDSRSTADKTVSFTLRAGELRQALTATLFSCDVDSTRYALGGILLSMPAPNSQLTLASTDSRRLSIYFLDPTDNGAALPEGCIVPHAAVKALLASLPKNAQESVAVRAGENDIAFQFGGIVILSRYHEGRFPRYLDVVPPRGEHIVALPVQSTLAAVKTATLATDEANRGIDFVFSPGALTLTAHNGAKTAVALTGETETAITLDPRYVSEFLESLPKGTVDVELHLIDANSAIKFHAGERHVYVMAPLARDRR